MAAAARLASSAACGGRATSPSGERQIAVLKFLELVLKNLRRNRVRTLLTGLAVLILATIYSVVSNATAFIGELVDNAADTRLVIREKWITPSRVPSRYARMIAGDPRRRGLDALAQLCRLSRRVAPGRPPRAGASPRGWKTSARCSPAWKISIRPCWKQMKHERTGALVGAGVMKMMDWQVGQRFTMTSMNYAGNDLEFKILGVLPGERWSHNFFFREDYFQRRDGRQRPLSHDVGAGPRSGNRPARGGRRSKRCSTKAIPNCWSKPNRRASPG